MWRNFSARWDWPSVSTNSLNTAKPIAVASSSSRLSALKPCDLPLALETVGVGLEPVEAVEAVEPIEAVVAIVVDDADASGARGLSLVGEGYIARVVLGARAV